MHDGVHEEIDLEPTPKDKGAFVEDFLRACLGLGDPVISISDTFRSAAVSCAINQSMSSGSPVDVDFGFVEPGNREAQP
jgi:hypothetical protein